MPLYGVQDLHMSRGNERRPESPDPGAGVLGEEETKENIRRSRRGEKKEDRSWGEKRRQVEPTLLLDPLVAWQPCRADHPHI